MRSHVIILAGPILLLFRDKGLCVHKVPLCTDKAIPNEHYSFGKNLTLPHVVISGNASIPDGIYWLISLFLNGFI